jgi:hypothetical protein
MSEAAPTVANPIKLGTGAKVPVDILNFSCRKVDRDNVVANVAVPTAAAITVGEILSSYHEDVAKGNPTESV